jgi:hypothetical protein
MTLAAIILVMAAVAMLRIVQRLEGMDFQPVAPVTLRRVIGLVIPGRELCIDPASLVAVKAEMLFMAVAAVFLTLVRQQSVAAQPVGIMIGRNSLTFVTGVAIGYLHVGIIFMRLFCGFFLGLFLRLISRGFLGNGQMSEKYRQYEEHE